MNDDALPPISSEIIDALISKGLMVRCAESCTAGLIMAALTAISGASAAVDRGYVSYSNAAKQEMLGVTEATLANYGAVSAETAYEMVMGAIGHDNANIAAISVTGIAGPAGGTADKPVGTIWIGTAVPGQEPLVKHYLFSGNRDDVRRKTVRAALAQLLDQLNQFP